MFGLVSNGKSIETRSLYVSGFRPTEESVAANVDGWLPDSDAKLTMQRQNYRLKKASTFKMCADLHIYQYYPQVMMHPNRSFCTVNKQRMHRFKMFSFLYTTYYKLRIITFSA